MEVTAVILGIRHHSPVCAWGVRATIEELQPAVVLVEGPADFTPLIPALLDERTVAPVAIMANSSHSGVFPLADFSPELVALRTGAKLGARLEFIDLPWDDLRQATANDESNSSALTESHFAHSRFLAAVAQQVHCRDTDEAWEQLFEQRPLADWRGLFNDVHAWAGLARSEYSAQALEAEGTLAREAHMAARIARVVAEADGPVVVVTGAFHVDGLLSQVGLETGVTLVEETEFPPVEERGTSASKPSEGNDPSGWLIGYDFAQLDSNRGYGAGLPAPGFYQRIWERQGTDNPWVDAALDVIAAVGQRTRTSGVADPLGTAQVVAAAEQALGLARLRGHLGPGRWDLIDSVTSVFVKGEQDSTAVLRDVLTEVFHGSWLGRVPPGRFTPPLIANTKAEAQTLGFTVTDTTKRTTRLDLVASQRARDRSRWLHRMSFCESGFATMTTGPQLGAGFRVGRLFEVWELSWNPLVEAKLAESALVAATLTQLAAHQFLEKLTQAGDVAAVARLLVDAAIMGLPQQGAAALSMMESQLDDADSLTAVVSAADLVFGLDTFKDIYPTPADLSVLGDRLITQAAFLLHRLRAANEETAEPALVGLAALRDLLSRFGYSQTITQMAGDYREYPPLLRGALAGIQRSEGTLPQDDFVAEVAAQLAPGSDSGQAVAFVSGLLRLTPENLIRDRNLVAGLDRRILSWSEHEFRTFLPALRIALAELRPADTAHLAGLVAALHGLASDSLDVGSLELTQAQADFGMLVNDRLAAVLAADYLAVLP